MTDEREVLATIEENPGLRVSQIVEMLDLPRRRVEDAVWNLYCDGKIQIDADSTMRVPREGEKIFRYDT